MDVFLYLGVIVIGLVHAAHVYRGQIRNAETPDVSPNWHALYFALWTVTLWILCGRFIIWYWLLALVPFLIAKYLGKTLTVATGNPR